MAIDFYFITSILKPTVSTLKLCFLLLGNTYHVRIAEVYSILGSVQSRAPESCLRIQDNWAALLSADLL